MMRIPTDILSTWPDCYEVPELWIPLQRGREPPQGAALSAALLRRRARLTPPVSILRNLLLEGEFTAALALLAHSGFCARVRPEELPVLRQEILKRRAMVSRSVTVSAELERLRAQRLQVPSKDLPLKQVVSVAQESLPEALAALAKIKEELDGHEATEALAISRTLGLSQPNGGPSGRVPPRPAWPYPHPPLEVCRWFRATREQSAATEVAAPRGFFAQWTPVLDESGWQMLHAMESLLQTPLQQLTPEMTVRFAAALSAFLGAPQQTALEARPLPPAGFLIHIPELCDKSCPPFSQARFPMGIPLMLGDGSAGRQPEAPFSLHFGIRPPGSSEASNAIYLEPALLFRLMGDPHRRQNFLRELGDKIPPVHGVSLPSSTDVLGVASFASVQRYLLSCLNCLGIGCDPPHVLDRIVYYSGGHQALLDALLYGIAQVLGNSRGPISAAHLEAAWNGDDFRSVAKRLLLKPLDGQPQMLSALGGLARFSGGDLGNISATDLQEWLDAEGIQMELTELEQALQQLYEKGLVERTEHGGYDLVRSSTNQLTLSFL